MLYLAVYQTILQQDAWAKKCEPTPWRSAGIISGITLSLSWHVSIGLLKHFYILPHLLSKILCLSLQTLHFCFTFSLFLDFCRCVLSPHYDSPLQMASLSLRDTNSPLVTCVQHSRNAMACNVHILICQFPTPPNEQNEHSCLLFTGEMHYSL